MSASHIHVIDNRQVSYPNDSCPICRPETQQQQQQMAFVPNVHRTGNTIVVQQSKGVMSTTNYWDKESVFLHSIRKIQRDADNRTMRGQDGKPLWGQLTIRMNLSLAKSYVVELSKLIAEVEKVPVSAQSSAPQRA